MQNEFFKSRIFIEVQFEQDKFFENIVDLVL